MLERDFFTLLFVDVKRGENIFQGRNDGDRKIVFKGDASMLGEMVRVRIDSATVTTLTGTIVD